MFRRLRKVNWRRGGGELIGFALVLPIVMMVFCAIIMAAQLGLARQTIEYTTYSACRAAVICETETQAQLAAEKVVDDMIYSIPGVRDGSAQVVIHNYTGNRWEKGGLVNCTVTVTVDTITPWTASDVTADITMMIERPAVAQTGP